MGDVSDPESDGVEVKLVVIERKLFCITHHPRQACTKGSRRKCLHNFSHPLFFYLFLTCSVVQPLRSPSADSQHLLVDVADDRPWLARDSGLRTWGVQVGDIAPRTTTFPPTPSLLLLMDVIKESERNVTCNQEGQDSGIRVLKRRFVKWTFKALWRLWAVLGKSNSRSSST